MKNLFSALGMVLAASFSLVSCAEDRLAPVDNAAGVGVPFEISTVITKTSNEGTATKWAEGDNINLFHAVAGATTYTSDGEFTIDEGLAGKFSGTLASALTDGTQYDWYANYPYSSYQKTPAGVSQDTGAFITIGGTTQTQTGNSSTAHLSGKACPLYGVAKSVASDEKPVLTMKNLASVVAIEVTNTLDDDLTVTSVAFTSTESIVGQYFIDYSGDTPAYAERSSSTVSATANLTVSGGTAIAKGKSAIFYIAIKPHTVKSGSDLVVSVNGISKTLTLTKDITFTAGSRKPIGYNYDYVKTIVETKDDEITLSTTGVTATSYTDWNGKKGSASDAVYAGNNAAKDNEAIQLRSSKSTSGIISTVSGGKVKKVSVTWNSNTTDGSTLNVYGSNNAYTAVGNLYTSSTQGTLLGTIVKGTSTELEINGDYTYVGLRSKSGALYLDKVVIAWDASGVSKDPVIVASDVMGVSARGCSAEALTFSITNPVEGTSISATCDGTVVSEVEMDSETILYSVSENITGAAREGKITLTYGSVTKDVKVSQNADTFKTSIEEVILDAEAGSTTTLTVTSDYDWIAESSDETKFTISPDTYTWAEGGKQTVTVTAVSANASEDGTITLGTITFSNTVTEETKVVTVKQKSSYVVTGTTVTVNNWNTLFGTDYSGRIENVSANSLTLTGTSGDITISATNGSSTNGYLKDADFRCYSGYTLTISVPEGKVIKKITTTKGGKTYSSGISSDSGTTSISDNALTWTSGATGTNKVVLTISGTVSFGTMSITYE